MTQPKLRPLPPFTALIAHTDRGGDQPLIVEGNPQVIRSTYRFQNVPRDGKHSIVGLSQGVFSDSSGTLNVSNASFPSGDRIILGDYELVEGVHWTGTNGNTGATAADIATAIDNLPEYTATDVGSDVNVTGPHGPNPPFFRVVNQTSPGNLDTDGGAGNGFLNGGGPLVGPPTIT